MSRLVFMVEEPSMKALLEGLLPRLVPQARFLCIAHEGRHDLERSIPRKLRAWREPGVRFVVVRDNDGGDCNALKDRLGELCSAAGREDTLIRIACQELEAWYLGDLEALANAYDRPDLLGLSRKARYRDPDVVPRPSAELARLVPEFQKVAAARLMATRLSGEGNRSGSFQVLLSGVRQVVAELAQPDEHGAAAIDVQGDD